MKNLFIKYIFLVTILAIIPCYASAQLPDTLDIQFQFEGFGNMITDSPPYYSGDVVDGDPLVDGGTWWTQIDDTGWPGTGDPDTRWNYIFDNFFVYDSYSYNWTAVFDGNSLAEKPTWGLTSQNGSTMGGTLVITFTFSDWDMDGILDIEERTSGMFSGTMMVMKYGTGDFAKYCGDGSYNGTLQNSDPANYVDDYVSGNCDLGLINCEISVDDLSWGSIKEMYR